MKKDRIDRAFILFIGIKREIRNPEGELS